MAMPRVLIAPNSFKHFCSAREAAELIARGFASVLPKSTLHLLPVTDGGDGLIDCLTSAYAGSQYYTSVHDPLFRMRTATFGMYAIKDVLHGVVEIAEAAGSVLLKPQERQSMVATTYGVGELLRAAAGHGARIILTGLGGCIASDMGMGLAQELGFTFFDRRGRKLTPIANGGFNALSLKEVWDIRPPSSPPLGKAMIKVLSDANIPLLGPHGQANTFGPQKGLSPLEQAWLEEGLTHFAERIAVCFGVHVDVPFAGAGGGMAAALMGLLGAEICCGADFACQTLKLDEILTQTDVCVTAEGCMDASTVLHKAPWHVCSRARLQGIPVYFLAGCKAPGTDTSFCEHVTVVSSMEEAQSLLQHPELARERLMLSARELALVIQKRFFS